MEAEAKLRRYVDRLQDFFVKTGSIREGLQAMLSAVRNDAIEEAALLLEGDADAGGWAEEIRKLKVKSMWQVENITASAVEKAKGATP